MTAIAKAVSTTGSFGLMVSDESNMFKLEDAASGWTRYQEVFDAEEEFGPNPSSEEDHCHPGMTLGTELWIDADRGQLLVEVTYGAGPCFCDSEIVHYSRELEPLPESLAAEAAARTADNSVNDAAATE